MQQLINFCFPGEEPNDFINRRTLGGNEIFRGNKSLLEFALCKDKMRSKNVISFRVATSL